MNQTLETTNNMKTKVKKYKNKQTFGNHNRLKAKITSLLCWRAFRKILKI